MHESKLRFCRDPFMIAQFVNGDIPYVRAGSSRQSLAHDDAEASAILEVLSKVDSSNAVQAEAAAAGRGVSAEGDGGEESVAHDRPLDADHSVRAPLTLLIQGPTTKPLFLQRHQPRQPHQQAPVPSRAYTASPAAVSAAPGRRCWKLHPSQLPRERLEDTQFCE